MRFKSLISLVASPLLLAGSGLAEPVALLGLYEAAAPAAPTALAASGCSLRREGMLQGARGGLALPAANRFVLLECEASLLSSPDGAGGLPGFGATPVWIEGALAERAGLDAAAAPGRAYVIKLSRYNDADPAGRERDVAAINALAAKRENGFRNEAVIAVSRASGVAKPDEVTVLYYDDPAAAKAFREANGDLLKRVGGFNETHLVDFVYLNATVVP